MNPTEFKLTFADRPVGRIAIVTIDNGEDYKKPTTFSAHAFASLSDVLDRVENEPSLAGLLLTGKPYVFAAGADLSMFKGLDRQGALAGARMGHEAFGRLQALTVPTMAAINGVCMGGGLEIALHCDVRTVSTGARAVAFPEVFLSILPGWGGTQLAPRLVGARNAVDTIIINPLDNNRTMRPADVVERGYADRLIDAATFVDDSLAWLEQIIAGTEAVDRDVDPSDGLEEALAAGRAAADARTNGATPAPYRALELIEFAAKGGDLSEGRSQEQEALADLLSARHAQSAVYAFELVNQRVKRQVGKPDVAPREISRVAIIGAGLMGAQLGALHLLRLEVPLVMKDIDQDVLDRCRASIDDAVDQRVARGRLDAGHARFLKSLVTTTTTYDEVAGADWVMEAVLEDVAIKQRVLADAEQVLDNDAVIATNTSSLSVGEIAAKLSHPERVVGLHFFNPVAILPLVEVVRASSTSDQAVATAFEVAKNLRKSAVACADAPAFIVNRLLIRFNGAAMAALGDGTAFRDIDLAIKRLGLPMGPFELFGLVGLKVAFHTAASLADAFPDRFAIDENFAMMGEVDVPGIYDWSAGGEVYPEVSDLLTIKGSAAPWEAERIQQVALEAVADEIGHLLDDGVVDDVRDIDTAMLLGAGWPFFNGGICPYLDATGISQRVLGRSLLA
ncbi:MAG: 3-hydroxyacyl-CoA dehydrogenase NAD-binding domain-containing protein [Nitriliruptoraceae bacterium]